MINRILIRMKVVQMLYSYLLTRSDFNILPMPETAATSRDKRFAYSLYCDLMILLIEQSGYKINIGNDRPVRFEQMEGRQRNDFTRVAQQFVDGEEMAAIATEHRSFIDALDPIRLHLKANVRESAIFKEYSRKAKQPDIQTEVEMWRVVMNTVLLRDPKLIELIRSNPDFTHAGYDQALVMFNSTLADYSSVKSQLIEARNGLNTALDKSHELYFSLLKLMIDLTEMRGFQLDDARNKYLPTDDDLNPSTRFIDNQFIEALRNNAALNAYIKDTPISWIDDRTTLRSLLDRIMAGNIYRKYMEAPSSSFSADCEVWYKLMKDLIIDSDDLTNALEEQSVYWNDDINIIGSFVLKTIRAFSNSTDGQDVALLPKFGNPDDETFGQKLFEDVIANRRQYRNLIDENLETSRWDTDRVAFMDIVILLTAIAEVMSFPSIPTVVTINEYTEIANYYSTPKSGQFITGILYSIINGLKKSGQLIKE